MAAFSQLLCRCEGVIGITPLPRKAVSWSLAKCFPLPNAADWTAAGAR